MSCSSPATTRLTEDEQTKLEALDIPVIDGGIDSLEIVEDRLTGVRLDDGNVVAVDAAVVATPMVARSELFSGIGLEPTSHPAGAFIETDAFGQTAMPGVLGGRQRHRHRRSGQWSRGRRSARRPAHQLHSHQRGPRLGRGAAGGSPSRKGRLMTHSFDKDYWERTLERRARGDDELRGPEIRT